MKTKAVQLSLPLESFSTPDLDSCSSAISNNKNGIDPQDYPFHNWYRFILSFPPHLVRDYIHNFALTEDVILLDPFCGTGTTLVEAKLQGITSIGIEANPFPYFATTVKTNWDVDPDKLLAQAETIANETYYELVSQDIDDKTLVKGNTLSLRTLSPDAMKALIKNSISPLPLHKTLVLLDKINLREASQAHKYYLLCLGNALVNSIGNLRFGPEVGIGKVKSDSPVVASWLSEVRKVATDLKTIQGKPSAKASVFLADARELSTVLEPMSIDAVITSPPYPNEKDYTRTTRLESVILGFFEDMSRLRGYKKTLLRSNTRGVYKIDDDDKWVAKYSKIQKIAESIEARRIEMGKTSGFEKLYARVTKLYFGGMVRHLLDLQPVLRPGAKLAYVVGDQASYLRVMIRTGELLAEIAEDLGYEVERIDLFRTRFATATQCDLREEVVVFKWPGK